MSNTVSVRVRPSLLGLWDGDELRHVGVCSQFTCERRRELLRELLPLAMKLAYRGQ